MAYMVKQQALILDTLDKLTVLQAILGRHLATLPNNEIRDLLGETLTDATLELYNWVSEKLPPTPSRFHYVFNLRDLSRVRMSSTCIG